jgi:type II secretory pathway pseudopilin PulG
MQLMDHSTLSGDKRQMKSKQIGFTYIGIIVTVAILGVGLAITGPLWKKIVYIEKEKQLLYVGDAFSKAIESYYENSPNSAKFLPKSFNDLVSDKRFPKPKRHLRKIFIDPMTANKDWVIIYQGQYIVGVFSKSNKSPIKKANFDNQYEFFGFARTYQDWKFVPEGFREASMYKPPD